MGAIKTHSKSVAERVKANQRNIATLKKGARERKRNERTRKKEKNINQNEREDCVEAARGASNLGLAS
jgi:hypothetical protein